MSTKLRLTLEEYDRMIERGVFDPRDDRRIELIHGELREMTPAGPTHAEVIARLNAWSFENLDLKTTRVWIQNPISLPNSDSAPEPDVAWLKPKSYLSVLPASEDVLLVIEVSDSSLAFDQGGKAGIYAQAGISDYWIVNIPNWCVEVYREPVGETYQSVTRHDSAASVFPLAFPDVELVVAELFRS